jgi:hypothetical protein
VGIDGFMLEDPQSIMLDVPEQARYVGDCSPSLYSSSFHLSMCDSSSSNPFSHDTRIDPTLTPTTRPIFPLDKHRKLRAQKEAFLAIQDTKRLKETDLFKMADDGIRGACPYFYVCLPG